MYIQYHYMQYSPQANKPHLAGEPCLLQLPRTSGMQLPQCSHGSHGSHGLLATHFKGSKSVCSSDHWTPTEVENHSAAKGNHANHTCKGSLLAHAYTLDSLDMHMLVLSWPILYYEMAWDGLTISETLKTRYLGLAGCEAHHGLRQGFQPPADGSRVPCRHQNIAVQVHISITILIRINESNL